MRAAGLRPTDSETVPVPRARTPKRKRPLRGLNAWASSLRLRPGAPGDHGRRGRFEPARLATLVAMDSKEAARERLDEARDALVELSHRIHAHPELGYEEELASNWLCEYLDA